MEAALLVPIFAPLPQTSDKIVCYIFLEDFFFLKNSSRFTTKVNEGSRGIFQATYFPRMLVYSLPHHPLPTS